jgi:hypothetical protein
VGIFKIIGIVIACLAMILLLITYTVIFIAVVFLAAFSWIILKSIPHDGKHRTGDY